MATTAPSLGWIHAESITTHGRLSAFREQLDAVGVKYELLSVTQSQDPTELLTERQREFVTEALERGYYDSPRRCSLTDIADALGVNKATTSGILHRAEGAIIKEFMEGPSDGVAKGNYLSHVRHPRQERVWNLCDVLYSKTVTTWLDSI